MTKLDDLHKAFIREHATDDTHRLLLSVSRYPEIEMELVVRQIEGRRKAVVKLPSLLQVDDFIYPSKLAMEQCSSEQTALYKASLLSGGSVADLTGGLGIDALFMSRKADSYCYVEHNEALTHIASSNFNACGANVEVHCDDGLEFLKRTGRWFDCIYLDPARRDGNNNKMVMLASCEPDVPAHLELLWEHTARILVKTSPMLDISMAVRELGCVAKIYVVAVKNECKELLFECRAKATEHTIVCVNLDSVNDEPFAFAPEEERLATVGYAPIDSYLYEPNTALLKAGAFRLPALRFGLRKLHPDTHLYTSSELKTDFPGRIFRVMATGPLNRQTVTEWLPDRKANVAVRNFPQQPEEIKKKFGLTDGGEAYLFAATLCNGDKRVILCHKYNTNKKNR